MCNSFDSNLNHSHFTYHPLSAQCNVQLMSMMSRLHVVIGHHNHHHVRRVQQLQPWCLGPWALRQCQKLHCHRHGFLLLQELVEDWGLVQTSMGKTDDNSFGFDWCSVIWLLSLCFFSRIWSDGAIAVKAEALVKIMLSPLIWDWGDVNFLWWLQTHNYWFLWIQANSTYVLPLSKCSIFHMCFINHHYFHTILILYNVSLIHQHIDLCITTNFIKLGTPFFNSSVLMQFLTVHILFFSLRERGGGNKGQKNSKITH